MEDMRSVILLVAALTASFACAPTVRHAGFLKDADCGRNPLSLTTLEGIRVTGHCVDEGMVAALHMTVSNTAPSRHGSLKAFDLEFCGTAISVDTPKGWVFHFVETNPEPVIEFTVGNETATSFSIPPGKALDGFVIRLSRGWRRKTASGARWDGWSTANGTTHDFCQ
jgi:hypothetical protein